MTTQAYLSAPCFCPEQPTDKALLTCILAYSRRLNGFFTPDAFVVSEPVEGHLLGWCLDLEEGFSLTSSLDDVLAHLPALLSSQSCATSSQRARHLMVLGNDEHLDTLIQEYRPQTILHASSLRSTLTLWLHRDQQWKQEFLNLFPPTWLQMVQSWRHHPQRSLQDLPLLEAASLQAFYLRPSSSTKSEGELSSFDGCLHRLARWARHQPDKVALRASGQQMTYAQLWGSCLQLAVQWQHLGLQKGHRLLILPSRTIELPLVVLSAFLCGVAIALVDPRHPDTYLEQCLGLLRPQALINLAERLLPLELGAEGGLTLLSRQTIRQWLAHSADRPLSWAPPEGQEDCFAEDEMAILCLTSGTSGQPKAVAGRYSSLVAFFDGMEEQFGPLHSLTFGMCSSLGHDPLQRDLFTPLYVGGHPRPAWGDRSI